MTGEIIAIYATAISLLIGSFFVLVGVVGLLKFDGPMTRLHAPTKVGTMGIGMLLVASMIEGFARGEGSLHELLIMAFLFVTAPISANFMAKVSIHKRACDMPLPPKRDEAWSTLNTLPDDQPEPAPAD